MKETLCAVYLRISLDRKMDGLAIDRQRGECMRILNERGWKLYKEYVDQSKSATNKAKKRPAYDEMVADYKQGKFSAIVCYDLDRLTRQPRQLEDWIDAAQDKGLKLVTANGEADLTTDGGRMYARVKAAVAAAEVERKGERQHLAHQQRAAQGRPPAGIRPLGYLNDGTIVEDEAKAVREIYKAFDTGSSLRSIARALSGKEDGSPNVPTMENHTRKLFREKRGLSTDAEIAKWNEEHAKTSAEDEEHDGKTVPPNRPWAAATVLGILRNPRYAAYSTYTDLYALKRENRRRSWRAHIVRDDNGSPVMGNWEPIIDLGTWERVQDKLDDPQRAMNRQGTDRRHLGSGLFLCGVCGEPVRSHSRGYRCAGHITRNRKNIDAFVLDVVRARISEPDYIERAPSVDEPRRKAIAEEIERHRGRILRAQADYDNELIEAFDLKRVRAKEQAAIDALEAERLRLASSSALADVLAADDPVEAFDRLDLMQKRSIIDKLMTVRIMPHPKGVKRFDGTDISIEWKDGIPSKSEDPDEQS